MPEVKGNRMQFLKHVLWLHQLKPNDSTRKRNCKYSLASSSKKIGQYEEANSHAALTSFCVEHKIKPWVKKKKNSDAKHLFIRERNVHLYRRWLEQRASITPDSPELHYTPVW